MELQQRYKKVRFSLAQRPFSHGLELKEGKKGRGKRGGVGEGRGGGRRLGGGGR